MVEVPIKIEIVLSDEAKHLLSKLDPSYYFTIAEQEAKSERDACYERLKEYWLKTADEMFAEWKAKEEPKSDLPWNDMRNGTMPPPGKFCFVKDKCSGKGVAIASYVGVGIWEHVESKRRFKSNLWLLIVFPEPPKE